MAYRKTIEDSHKTFLSDIEFRHQINYAKSVSLLMFSTKKTKQPQTQSPPIQQQVWTQVRGHLLGSSAPAPPTPLMKCRRLIAKIGNTRLTQRQQLNDTAVNRNRK